MPDFDFNLLCLSLPSVARCSNAVSLSVSTPLRRQSSSATVAAFAQPASTATPEAVENRSGTID